MNQFNLGSFLNNFAKDFFPPPQGKPMAGRAFGAPQTPSAPQQAMANSFIQKSLHNPQLMNNFSQIYSQSLRMNELVSSQKSLYLRDLMNLPKEMQEILMFLQKDVAMSKQASTLLMQNISISDLAALLQANAKDAMNKLVFVMAEASKQGLSDVSQLKEAIKLINASVSVAGQENSSQVLKNFMLLYLPWLPLKEGVDFELEVETSESQGGESEDSITILITTINFGNIKAVLILNKSKSIDIVVSCSENFPKEELLERISGEGKKHSVQTGVVFDEKSANASGQNTHQAKVCMSNLSEVNPFLLLMANAVIRHTIEIDNEFSAI